MNPRKPVSKKKSALFSRQDITLMLICALLGGILSFYHAKIGSPQANNIKQEMKPLSRDLKAQFILEDDIGQAGFDPRASFENRSPMPALVTTTELQLRLQADFNLSGKYLDEKGGEMPESLIYSYDANNKKLYRNQSVLLDHLESFGFNYENNAEGTKVVAVKVAWQQFGKTPVQFTTNLRNPN